MKVTCQAVVLSLQLLAASALVASEKISAANDLWSSCLLEIPTHEANLPELSSYEANVESALNSFYGDLAVANVSASLHFVSYAISGAAAVYTQSVGRQEDIYSVDVLGREVVRLGRRLLTPEEWTRVLRAANLQLSIALAQLYTTKALLVVNLHLDGDSVAQLFAPDRVAETFLTALAWSQLPQVADELRFFAYRLEALVLVNAPPLLSQIRFFLQAFIYHLYSFSQGQGDLRAVARDVQLISDLSTSVCSKAEGPRAHENPFPLTSACADVSLAVASYADSYTKVLNGRGAPRVHVSPVGDAYYLKRFISPPDMPNVYLPHSRQTLEGSAEQQRLKRFLTRCLESLFTTKRLRYPSAERRRSVAADLEAARKALKKDFLLHQSQH
ncbi:hypothetical protein cyc_08619 [Cyclospora cayetanensis]|uniref:Uncharacterized protein n=1 Tax=Cyclospora cayetanensis TaxID=88456 RepID=A0A1D3DA51_9EIME|nr:hypothetical protein cyc_08619 [Cyclospora cayetanensis]